MTKPNDELNSEDELREMFERFQGPDSPSPLPKRGRRRRLGFSLAFALPLLAGVVVASVLLHASDRDHSQAIIIRGTAGLCADSIEFEGRQYLGNRVDPDESFQRGEFLGTGVIPACYDSVGAMLAPDGTTITTDSDGYDVESVNVYSVVGIKPVDAVMIGSQSDKIIYITQSISDRLIHGDCPDTSSLRELLQCMSRSSMRSLTDNN